MLEDNLECCKPNITVLIRLVVEKIFKLMFYMRKYKSCDACAVSFEYKDILRTNSV
ncbi:hypothetical protein DPMN_086965 [Dreissena polymorpha]|uniref:Uncharacterized protein n=1 Tax=Dreissena polymorpha TaxID=45954 RepID=A0A9D4KS47_DREPO|nr:hypothetical protein DPMN_086965 [Dreissena polymorpha]